MIGELEAKKTKPTQTNAATFPTDDAVQLRNNAAGNLAEARRNAAEAAIADLETQIKEATAADAPPPQRNAEAQKPPAYQRGNAGAVKET